jgi:molybdenum cofactor cytidylyltransferase
LNYKINGLLLAAGFSKRMGKPKALLLQEDLTFAIVIPKKMQTICDNVVIVVGHSGNLIKEELKKYIDENPQLKSKTSFVINKNYSEGMTTSLQCGLRELKNSEWILYHFVDQPKLNLAFYKNFTGQIANGYNWIQPAFEGIGGHPILIHNSVFKLILDLSPNSSLRDLKSHSDIRKKLWKCDYPEILHDIDTPSDL